EGVSVPEPTRARSPAGREGLAPAGLQDFADCVGTGREAGEDIVPGGVSRYRARHRAAELDAPALDATPWREAYVNLAVDRHGSTTSGCAPARPCRGRRRRRRRQRPRVRYGIRTLVDGFARVQVRTHRAVRRVVTQTRIVERPGSAVCAALWLDVARGSILGHARDQRRGDQGEKD